MEVDKNVSEEAGFIDVQNKKRISLEEALERRVHLRGFKIISNDGIEYPAEDFPHCNQLYFMITEMAQYEDIDKTEPFPVAESAKYLDYVRDYERIVMRKEDDLKMIDKKEKEEETEIDEFKKLLEEECKPYKGGEFMELPEDLYAPFNYDIDDPYWKKRIPEDFQEFAKSIPMPSPNDIGYPTDEEIRIVFGDDFMSGCKNLYQILWCALHPGNLSDEVIIKNWYENFLDGDVKNIQDYCKEKFEKYRDRVPSMEYFENRIDEKIGTRYPCHDFPGSSYKPLVEKLAEVAHYLDLRSLTELTCLMMRNTVLEWARKAYLDSVEKGLEGASAYYNEKPIHEKISIWLSEPPDGKSDKEKIEIRENNKWIYETRETKKDY